MRDKLGVEYRQSVGERIAFFRKKAEITQMELADLLELSNSESISRYERGDRVPSIATLLTIGSALNISARCLLPEPSDSERRNNWLNSIFKILTSEGGFAVHDALMVTDVIKAVTKGLASLGYGTYPSDSSDENERYW